MIGTTFPWQQSSSLSGFIHIALWVIDFSQQVNLASSWVLYVKGKFHQTLRGKGVALPQSLSYGAQARPDWCTCLFYNHRKKKTLTHFVWFRRKRTPLPPPPHRNVDPNHVVRSLAGSPKHWLMRSGKDYDKSENLCFLLNNVMPHFLFQW